MNCAIIFRLSILVIVINNFSEYLQILQKKSK